MLDLVLSDANSLSNKLGKEDRGRLDQYLTAVRELNSYPKAESWLETQGRKLILNFRKFDRNVLLKARDYLRTM